MDVLKEPAIIFCIILLFIIICVAIFLYQRMSLLSERTSALEGVLVTLTKEGTDFREKSKNISSLVSTVTEQNRIIENMNSTIMSMSKEIKEQKRYMMYLTEKLTESGISGLKPYNPKGLAKSKSKKKSVTFDSDSEDDDDDSESEYMEVKKALKAKKGKEK